MVSKFVAESRGKDVRAIVIGGKFVGAMLRRSETDFRSNAAAGGKCSAYSLDEKAVALCEKVAKGLNLDYCGIDLLFKDDGLSGIVTLNISSKINSIKDKNNIKIQLDLAKGYDNISKDDYLEYVPPKIATYMSDNNLNIHQVSFTFKGFYDFNIAEVSHGGLSLNEISASLESKKEKNLYFAGEILDIDGMCGGYNLMFSFASAETIAKAIKE